MDNQNNVARIDTQKRGEGMGSFKLLQISDCHLGSEPHTQLLGMDTDASLHDVLSTLVLEDEPDMLLVSGDISNDGGPVSYARFLSIIDKYFPQTPLAWLPGNHDDTDNMLSIGKHPIELSHRINGWHFVFLNSRIPGEEGGRLGERELKRLRNELERHAGVPTAIFLHHQLVPVGCKWVDQYVVEDADAFFEVIDEFEQVKLVSWGHVHQDFSTVRNGVTLMASPSTCVQFLPNSDEFQLDTRMPGYRSYSFKQDGEFDTRVGRAQEKNYAVDMTATGY